MQLHTSFESSFSGAWCCVFSFILPGKCAKGIVYAQRILLSVGDNSVCRDWGSEGALSLKHIVTSWACVFGPLSAFKSSAISLNFRGGSYLSPAGNKQNSQNQACEQGEPCMPPARSQCNLPSYFFPMDSPCPPLYLFQSCPSFKAPPNEFPALSEFSLICISAMRCPSFI